MDLQDGSGLPRYAGSEVQAEPAEQVIEARVGPERVKPGVRASPDGQPQEKVRVIFRGIRKPGRTPPSRLEQARGGKDQHKMPGRGELIVHSTALLLP